MIAQMVGYMEGHWVVFISTPMRLRFYENDELKTFILKYYNTLWNEKKITSYKLKVFALQVGLTWVEAHGQCEIYGGYLAEATTEGEHEFLKSITVLLEV